MLNTFRVIFVDNNGVEQNPTIGNCEYLQTGQSGYYAFDHGQPTTIAGEDGVNLGSYSYDSRTINDWYRKYGIEPSIFGGTNPSLFPPANLGLDAGIYGVSAGDVVSGVSGSIFSSAGMTSAGKYADGSGLYRDFDEDVAGVPPWWNVSIAVGPPYRNLKRNYGVTLDIRTPTYFFNDSGDGTGNKNERDISRTGNIELETASDLIFTHSPAESNPPENEIDLSDPPTDHPKWVYIGLMAAGGPGGLAIQSLAGYGSTSGPSCQPIPEEEWNVEGLGLCSLWRDNKIYNNDLCDGTSDQWSEGRSPIISHRYGGPSSWAQNGGRLGIFLNTCKLGLNDAGTARRTLVVRINKLGRGGVEKYDNTYREYTDTETNRERTDFPKWDDRRTSISIYDAGNDKRNLSDDDKLLTVWVDGGYAQIMQVFKTAGLECKAGFDRPNWCASCSGGPQNDLGDDYYDCLQDCSEWTSDIFTNGEWAETQLYNEEVYLSLTDLNNFANVPPVPAFSVETGKAANVGNWQENRDYIVTDELSRTPAEGEQFTDASARPGFRCGGRYFAPELESEIGIVEVKDWYRKAGGIQKTPETVTIDTLNSNAINENDFFGISPSFVFNGDTTYVFEQDLSSTEEPVQVPVYPTFVEDLLGLPPRTYTAENQYFRFDSDMDEYVLLEDIVVPTSLGDLNFRAEQQYRTLNRDPVTEPLDQPFGDSYWQNVSKCKVQTYLPVNSLKNTITLSKQIPDSPQTDQVIEAEFTYNRATTELIAIPSLGGRCAATMIDSSGLVTGPPPPGGGGVNEGVIDIGPNADEFSEGAGGNGGSVFIGWGEDINAAAQKALENRNGLGPSDSNPGQTQLKEFVLRGSPSGAEIQFGEGPWPDYRRFRPKKENLGFPVSSDTYYDDSPRLGSISSHVEFFVANTGSINEDLTFNRRVRSAYDMATIINPYTPVGDPDAKGYDVAPIARFTELPELTREGDFYVTLQAYHMEGIHKVTFVMDKGWGVDVYAPVKHPDNLDTNYEGSASGLGKDYEEYMVKVSTEDMENNSVHEIRAIVWPNSGYPLVLQGEKQDSNRFIKGSASASGNAGIEIADELYKVTPTSYPWIPNRYPEMMGQYNPNQQDVSGNPLTIAPNPDTGGITLTDEPAWYSPEANSSDYLATINVDPADVKGQYIEGAGSEDYAGEIKTWQAVPGGLVDNFEGHVDDLGEPAWWIPGAETNNVGYHGFWFRYQKSGDATVPADTNKYPDEGHRRVLYVDSSVDVNSSGRDTALLGTIDHPYQSLDEVMDALETGDHPEIATGTYEIEDYFSAKLILLGQKDSPAEGEPKGRIYKWWGSDNPITSDFQNCLDHNESRNSAQNPSCQMLTVEARKVDSETGIPVSPLADNGAPIDFHPDQDAVEIYDKEVVLLQLDGGWGREFFPNDPSKDNGGVPLNANIHYKNFRFVTDLPTANSDSAFIVDASSRRCDTWGPQYQENVDNWRYKGPTEIIDNCKINSWSEWGASSQLGYIDKSVLLKSNKIALPGPPTPDAAPTGACPPDECSYDEIDAEPLDRSKMRSIDVTLLEDGVHPAVWEKVGITMNYIWEGDRFPDSENDIIGPNRQLLDDRLPGYNTLIRWSFGDPVEISAQEAAISNGDAPEDYPDGLYVSTLNNGRGPDDVLPNEKITLTEDTSFNWRPLKVTETDGVVFGEGIPNQKRLTGSLKNDAVFTRKLVVGYPLNVDVYSSNCITSRYGAGRRFVGVNLVKNYIESNAAGDTTARSTSGIINCIVDIRSISYFTGKRLFANGTNTAHGDLNQIDRLDIGWVDNRIHADVLMPNNSSQLAHFSVIDVARRNSKVDYWRSAHKIRNWAIVNVISDSWQTANTWNCFEAFDHFYIRGTRLRKTHIRLTSNGRHGLPLLGERYDNRISHFYMADVNSGQVGIEAPTSADGIQGGWEVVNTNIADPEYKGFARPRPSEVETGVFKYEFSKDKSNAAFWPRSVSTSNGGAGDGYEATPIPTNQLYWYPVYDGQNLTSPGNYTADRNSQLIASENGYDDILRSSLAQYCDVSNSIIRFDTCIYNKWGSGGGKTVQGNIETNIFNQNGVPPIEKAYLIQGDDPSLDNLLGREYAVSAPNGVPTANKNAFTIDLDTVPPLNGDIQTVKFIPTYAGVSSDIERLSRGFTAPRGYSSLDPNSPDGEWANVKTYLKSNVEFVPSLNTNNGGEQWPRAGKVVEAYYLYDRELLRQIVANGGWNYTPELDTEYTPHKL